MPPIGHGPAIGAASLSLLTLLKKLGIQPDAVGGHSFGEVTTLHTAAGVKWPGLLLGRPQRGELMAEATTMFPAQ